ncbi:MAG: enoyl-[acyl-carrier protein] reductase I [Chlamydiales bacterium]|jgi:enoyl-[acyl-carrier protein] reductase I
MKLGFEGHTILITGVANKKSVAWHVAKGLVAEGGRAIYCVHTEERAEQVRKLSGSEDVHVCDVREASHIAALAASLKASDTKLDGLLHSIAFANYSNGPQPFHQTSKADFLDALDVSCFSLVSLSNALRDLFQPNASVVTISISTTSLAAENYGYMAPIKAALDSSVVFLAKSFSRFSCVRFNAVRAGLLKTASSAGIPGYIDSYIYAEKATLRKRGVATGEVADTALFLLSERSSGINAQGIVVDAGMGVNYFDEQIVGQANQTS